MSTSAAMAIPATVKAFSVRCLSRGAECQADDAESEGDKYETPYGILDEHGFPVSPESFCKYVLHPCVGTSREAAGKRSGRGRKGGQMPPVIPYAVTAAVIVFLSPVPVFHILSRARMPRRGDCNLKDDKSHGHGPELVIERHNVEPYTCEPEEVASPGKEYGKQCACRKPPFVPAFQQNETEYEQEDSRALRETAPMYIGPAVKGCGPQ